MRLKKDPAVKADPLFGCIRQHHTNKGVYDSSKAVAVSDLAKLTRMSADLSCVLTAPEKLQDMRKITSESYEIELTTPRTYLESAHLFRIGPNEIEKNPDGISITGMMPRILSTLGVFNRFEVPVKGSSNYKQVMDRWIPFETGSGYLWMATQGNSRRQQVECGRAYVRTHLLATALGIDMHPLSQAVQEFVEVELQNLALYRLLNLDNTKHTLQMVDRVGFGVKTSEGTPRKKLKQV